MITRSLKLVNIETSILSKKVRLLHRVLSLELGNDEGAKEERKREGQEKKKSVVNSNEIAYVGGKFKDFT